MDFKKYRDGMIEGISLRDRIIQGITVPYIRVDDCEDLDILDNKCERVMFFLLYNDLVSFIHGSLSKGESLTYNEKGYVELIMPYDKLSKIIKSINHFVNTPVLYPHYCEGLIEGLENVNTCRELKFDINEDEDPFAPADLKIMVDIELVADILKYRDDDFVNLAIKKRDKTLYGMSLKDRMKAGVPLYGTWIEDMYLHEHILEFLHDRLISDAQITMFATSNRKTVTVGYGVPAMIEAMRYYILKRRRRDDDVDYEVRDKIKFTRNITSELNDILADVDWISFKTDQQSGYTHFIFTIDVE